MMKRLWRWFVLFNKSIGNTAGDVVDAAKEQAEAERRISELFDNTKKGKATFEDNARRGEENKITKDYPLIKLIELLNDILNSGTWYPSALEIDQYSGDKNDGEDLERRIRDLLFEVDSFMNADKEFMTETRQ